MKTSMLWTNPYIASVLFFAAAFGVRAVEVYWQPMLSRDSILYIDWVAAIYRGRDGLIQMDLPPLPALLMTPWMFLGASAEFSARLSTLLAGAGVPVVGYAIARKTASPAVAVVSAIFFVFNPHLVEMSIMPLRDAFYLLFGGLTLYFLICGILDAAGDGACRWKIWGLAGGFFALSLLSRYETLEFLVLLPIYWSLAVARGESSWHKVLGECSAFFAGSLLVYCLIGMVWGGEGMLGRYWGYYVDKWMALKEIWSII